MDKAETTNSLYMKTLKFYHTALLSNYVLMCLGKAISWTEQQSHNDRDFILKHFCRLNVLVRF
jgi:hypothetical protein